MKCKHSARQWKVENVANLKTKFHYTLTLAPGAFFNRTFSIVQLYALHVSACTLTMALKPRFHQIYMNLN